jgi:hypothetical protein
MIDISRESDAGAKTSHHIYVHSNLFRKSGGGVFFTEGGGNDSTAVHHIYIYNNLIINGTACASAYDYSQFYFHGFVADFYIYNNTIYKSGSGTYGGLVASYDQRATMQWPRYKNNIYVTIDDKQPYFTFSGGYGDVYSDHDAFYGNTIPSGKRYRVTHARKLDSEPRFVNKEYHDFRLAAGSPCIDAGSQEVSSIVAVDYDGNPRPQGSAYDLGAFEYSK